MIRAVTALLIAFLPLCAAADWSTMGGTSQRDGRMDFVGPEDATLRWTVNDPCLFAGPIYSDGDYAVMMRFNTIGYSPLLCVDVNTGDELWTLDLPGENVRSLPVGFRDSQIYAVGFGESGMDTLYAINPSNGSIIWNAESQLHQGIIASAAFADNGDLIVNGVPSQYDHHLTRIDHETGEIVWQTDRVCAVVGGSEHVCVYGDRVYGWDGGLGQLEFTTWTLDTGVELYGISLPGDGDQEIPFTVTADSAIYIIRDGGDLFRLRDTGSDFEIVWQQPVEFGMIAPIGCHFAVLGDGDVVVPHGDRIKRHDSNAGTVIATSGDLVSADYMGYPRFAIDNNDTIYMSTGTSDGRLIALDSSNLSELWDFPITNQHYGAPAVGQNGDIITAGSVGVYCFEGVEGGDGDNEPPTDFALLFPENGAHLINHDCDYRVPFDWEDSVDPDLDDSVTYTLIVEHHGHPDDAAVIVSDLAESEYTMFDAEWIGLGWEDEDLFYYIDWTVVATDGDAEVVAYNAPSYLEYELLVAVNDPGLAGLPQNDMLIYPNPANAQATVAISLAQPSDVTVTVSDMLGRHVFTLPQGQLLPGTHRVTLNLNQYPSGTYMVHVRSAVGFHQTQRLVVVK